MIELLARLVINAALLLFISRLAPGLCVEGWGSAFIGAIVLGLVNFFVKPVMVILTFPFYHTGAGALPPGCKCFHAVDGVRARFGHPFARFRFSLRWKPSLLFTKSGNLHHCDTLMEIYPIEKVGLLLPSPRSKGNYPEPATGWADN